MNKFLTSSWFRCFFVVFRTLLDLAFQLLPHIRMNAFCSFLLAFADQLLFACLPNVVFISSALLLFYLVFAFSFFSDLLRLFGDFAFAFSFVFDFCVLPGSGFAATFSIFGVFVLSTQFIKSSVILLQFFCLFPACFSIPERLPKFDSAWFRMPSLWKTVTFGLCSFVWFFAGMCSAFFCFPLFFTRKRSNLHIIYIRHTWIWVLEDSPFALGLSSLCLYYSTYFSVFNPECCINPTISFNAKRRSPS